MNWIVSPVSAQSLIASLDMRVMVTGSAGFIGQNLCVRLGEAGHEVLAVTRQTAPAELRTLAARAEAVVHLAGVNRDADQAKFLASNDQFTGELCETIREIGRNIPLIAASTIQVGRETPYGRTKHAAEEHLKALSAATTGPTAIYRLVNVFGKWCRPNYNSVVSTFCHNIARDIPIVIDNPTVEIPLVHVDDVIDNWLSWLQSPTPGLSWPEVQPQYRVTVGQLAERIRGFHASRQNYTIGDVGVGLTRALYATYVSYLPSGDVVYPLVRHGDARGDFVEILRTESAGQFSYFTTLPGVTRGGHYHHSKTEKFVILKGHARFRFRDLATGALFSVEAHGGDAQVIESLPGWTHDVANIGSEEMLAVVWANEVFDRERPDTIRSEIRE
ncbi:MAG: NAD-dependent epimerase/dehydratase family protein [Terriglobia bacterium]|nr:NAD-dependent epimerase/dehydratase family protein [Terriglobia bacterium]